MPWKQFFSDYLRFSKSDRIGILVLLLLIFIVFLLPSVVPKKSQSSFNTDTAWVSDLKKIEQREHHESQEKDDNSFHDFNERPDYKAYNEGRSQPKELFSFDPNTLSFEGWQRLGLRDKTIHTIQKYLAKGSHFKHPEDLQKIYGLFPDEYQRIAPYIQIEDVNKTPDNTASVPDPKPATSKTYTPRYSVIDINTADTSAFISLPGIGSKLAARIVNFRDKLGGFYAVSQVGETFGLPDSTFQKIKQYLALEKNVTRKININTAAVEELKAHPYIRWNIANAIVAYRKEHGPFSALEDIKKVMAVTDEIYNRLSPYLSTN